MRRATVFIAVLAAASVPLGDDAASRAGVTFKQTEAGAPQTVTQAETRLPPALTLSNQLGERAARAAAAGDLEEARRLAELSAQAMTGRLTRNDLAKVRLADVDEAPGLPLTPAVLQAQRHIARELQERIAGAGQDPAARAAAVADFERLGAAYRRLRSKPTEAREVLDVLKGMAGAAGAADARLPVEPRAGGGAGGAGAAGESAPTRPAIIMLLVPAGRCTAAVSRPDDAAKPDREPHEITIARPFLLSRTEVTQAQFQGVTGREPWSGRPAVRTGAGFPAAWVTWAEAAAFCDRLTALERAAGRLAPDERYRLPSEEEWEYACRADSTTAYCFGDEAARLGDYAWFAGNASDRGTAFAHRVGTRLANGWGFHDMHGNVREWCAPAGGDAGGDADGAGAGTERVCRGGSWGHGAADCRSESRFPLPPKTGDGMTGFRIARDIVTP